ncbi:putative hydrolase R7 [Pseudocercospora fuligena]|uniref:Putative hydrolase R7 n=1 Tax=Pseudocercospora fuligena TaxID=685502 RepID=A0A8H6VI94_9PEZI|nr:putative hydrolase R7 [Pseudocercospora fuligena]
MSKPHIILVHGAYHRAWHLQPLKAELERNGYAVSTLDLPAAGPDPEKLPVTGGLRADTDAIKTLMEEVAAKSESMIAVLHSYGGIPGGEAAAELSEGARKKLKRLVYLAALVIPQGSSLFKPTGGKTGAAWAQQRDHIVFVPDPVPTFYHDCNPELAKEAARHVVPHSYSCFNEDTEHTPGAICPCTYVFTVNDRPVPISVQKMMLEHGVKKEHRDHWETYTLDTGHSPFLSDTIGCARLVRRIAGEEIPDLLPSALQL